MEGKDYRATLAMKGTKKVLWEKTFEAVTDDNAMKRECNTASRPYSDVDSLQHSNSYTATAISGNWCGSRSTAAGIKRSRLYQLMLKETTS